MPELVRFADALTGELGSILTRIPLLRLGARSGHYLDRPVTPTAREIHEALGVDYVLEGSVQARPDEDAERVRVTVRLLRNAIELSPANAQAWAALGSGYLAGNRPDEAIVHLRHGIRLSPLDSRLAIWGAVLAMAHLLLGDRVAAREQAELACQRGDRCYMPRIVLAAIHRLDGRHDLARQALSDAYRIKPDLSTEQVVALVGQKHGARLMAL
ncbi:hypothetical protein KG088_07970 [Halomonas sp. TRM85114]|uniref:hypothetical protein n=1 Tax=Halomonas jincaotanensis TaxID=2810616 RepID=UPI001BD1DAF8|nr:hypothetical protein [Halomonas jincaotanensis]